MAEVATEGSALPGLHLVLQFKACLQVLVLSGLEFCLHPLKAARHHLCVPSEAVKVSWPSLWLRSSETQA